MRVVQRRLRHAGNTYEEFAAAGDFQEVADKALHPRRVVGGRAAAIAQMATGALQLVIHGIAVAGLGDRLLDFFVTRRMALRRVGNGPGESERGGQRADETEE
ncbi:hypothetical protein D3C72_1831190 [compost metagenome]